MKEDGHGREFLDTPIRKGPPLNQSLPIRKALEVFLQGFSTTRSFTKSYQVSPLGTSAWLLADPPAGNGRERTSEIIAYRAVPEEIVAQIKRLEIERHFLCVMLDEPEAASQTSSIYKGLGYRFLGREPLFVLDVA